jgi:hypothetical protein
MPEKFKKIAFIMGLALLTMLLVHKFEPLRKFIVGA